MGSVWTVLLVAVAPASLLWVVRAFGERGGAAARGVALAVAIVGALPAILLTRYLGWAYGVIAVVAYAASAGMVWWFTERQARRIVAAWARDGLRPPYDVYGHGTAPGDVFGAPGPVFISVVASPDGLWLAPRVNAAPRAIMLPWAALRPSPPVEVPPPAGREPSIVDPPFEWRLESQAPGDVAANVIVCRLYGPGDNARRVHNLTVERQRAVLGRGR